MSFSRISLIKVSIIKGSGLLSFCFVRGFFFHGENIAKPTLASYAIKSIIAEYFSKTYQKIDVIQELFKILPSEISQSAGKTWFLKLPKYEQRTSYEQSYLLFKKIISSNIEILGAACYL